MASLAIELRDCDQTIGYTHRVVTPKTGLEKVQDVVLARILAQVFVEYKRVII
jgi:hypothetical protein